MTDEQSAVQTCGNVVDLAAHRSSRYNDDNSLLVALHMLTANYKVVLQCVEEQFAAGAVETAQLRTMRSQLITLQKSMQELAALCQAYSEQHEASTR